MSNDLIRIILVDDHSLARESWKSLLELDPRFEVVALCDNGLTAIETAQKLLPDIMLVDINMSPVNGFSVTEKVMRSNPEIKIIGLSVNNQSYYVHKMLELGAKGYLTKTSPLEEVLHGIIQVFEGKQYICKEIKMNMPTQQNNVGE
ncbi:MAG: response regulator transcription factor [Chitinophagaceae bacterium]